MHVSTDSVTTACYVGTVTVQRKVQYYYDRQMYF